MKKHEKQNPFGLKHKTLIFLGVMFLTILITRILVYFKDLDLLLFGYELHHFYYGITLLMIVNIAILFGRLHQKLYIILSAISMGLISDEFLFILGGLRNHEYPSTITHMIYTAFIIITILGIILYDFLGRFKKRK